VLLCEDAGSGMLHPPPSETPGNAPRLNALQRGTGHGALVARGQGTGQLTPSHLRETRGYEPLNYQARCSKRSAFS